MRNACQVDPDGSRVYFFSVNEEWLDRGCWRQGTVYVLPREGFCQGWLADGRAAQEWWCPHPVAPLARLAVTPEDFPYLDRVTGHDDAVQFRLLDDLAVAVRLASAVTSRDDTWQLTFDGEEGVEAAARLVPQLWGTDLVADLVAGIELRSGRGSCSLTLRGSAVASATLSRLIEAAQEAPA